ncbi:hypothetical protein [Paractinoplanes atraurantiacus]|uniref:Uncharacterized protein n=1 Tax=Paractinoplanes atraurantiacus TaxID=1036182 RepID=A0A285JJ73_9ACTN|nr:hypothetical protein [Actinoplanes atraurantiacus]SNY60334.1 hypothetical protein SAMN05421748_121103 [Actinoplanes atraurantiacus]
MPVTGRLIGDSLRPGAEFAPPGVRIVRVFRQDLEGTQTATQPAAWTVIDFEADDAEAVAGALAAALNPDGGWYADFSDGDDHIIVFAGRVFRCPSGDSAADEAAKSYGRSVGVPEHQLDWGSA